MGAGEKTMRNWGYAAGSLCVLFGVYSLIASVMALLAVKGSLTATDKQHAENMIIIAIVLAVIVVVVGAVAIAQVHKTNNIYLQVTYKTVKGTIPMRQVTPPSASTRPAATRSKPISTTATTATTTSTPAKTNDVSVARPSGTPKVNASVVM